MINSAGATEKDASTGVQTLEKKTRFKRAAKEDLTPAVMKKIKVSQELAKTYSKYVNHGRKFRAERTKKKLAIT